MFKSIKEKLTLIKNNPENQTHVAIANYLLNCIEEKKVPKIIECSKESFCSESVITAFSKKYGYDGFKELATRIKIETEYYNYSNVEKNATSLDYRVIIDNSIDMIDQQVEKIKKLINSIDKENNIYMISCYQQLFNVELFASELNLYGYNAFFNYQRKLNQAWINKAKRDDVFIFFCFGLDNQYIVNYYNLVKNTNKNVFVICSPSQKHKFDIYKECIVVDYYERSVILESSRNILIMYLLSYIVINLLKNTINN
ncbi:hypothetical protein SLITO_v1c06500 [Spiroplasma litorale]|uniref:HTH rpiR-type domain-containing protein n=1 Tax=Spiroplasma litorale TaxID=216942 RepID=A0A0K1W1U4_9MOLU|nr:hypothetical protein [Spiroplasma litorale]AKX34279.1 hypothetical protein SLITO_v1c06500 [Spiroplasma litorale]